MSSLQQKIEQSQTRIFKAVFPNTTNHYHTLFGGTAMSLMDEVTIIELIGTVVRVGRTSLDVEVQIYVEEMYADRREKAIVGTFTMVAVNDEKKPIPLL